MVAQFNQVVRVRSLVLHTKEVPLGAKDIKIFINKPALSFSDVEDAVEPEAVQVLAISEENVAQGLHVQLRFVRLQRVNSLHVRFRSFGGAET